MMVKRPALVDSKTGLPVYRQWTTSYPAPLAAVNTLQHIQSQPFISFPSKIRACIVRGYELLVSSVELALLAGLIL